MSLDTDVIIVGAGPAGLIAARELSQNDIDYIILDRAEKPGENKPCGGFIPSSTLQKFSIPKIDGQFKIDGVRMKFPGKDLVEISFDEMLGVNIHRRELAKSLIKSIDGKKQHIRFGTNVARIETNHNGCRIFMKNEGESSTLTSKLVIDGSGANPVTL